MDARLKLNQLRRNNNQSRRGIATRGRGGSSRGRGVTTRGRGFSPRGRITDLRQLIASKDKKITKLKSGSNSVKNRIGFKSKSSLQRQTLNQLKQTNETKIWTKNKKILLSGELPKVVVDLTKIPDSNNANKTSKMSTTNQVWTSSSISKNEQKSTVLVSNLNKTITENDIKELFGDIGPLVSASKINTSVAVVVYKNVSDARNACQTYHNRLLDGMPMQCNILFHPNEEYVVESPPKRPQSTSYSNLLAAQLRQINEIPLHLRGESSFSRSLYQ